MKQLNNVLEHAKRKALALLKDRQKVLELLDTASKRISGGVSAIDTRGLTGKLKAAVRLIRCSIRREYLDVPWQTLVVITAGIIYFVSPIDSLPDIIPLLGFTDDAAILAAIFASVKHDLDKFIEWENTRLARSSPAPTVIDATIEESRRS
ncbi:MAG: DUF1232 domain-containing protein [Chlorobiaceae bacterium]|nr:DUF1232 domain-containing protein [Chlorobiaceae bacterium]NTW73339.1 DUF1232 domain-containing protein [Chlorobiaceae bacterium]